MTAVIIVVTLSLQLSTPRDFKTMGVWIVFGLLDFVCGLEFELNLISILFGPWAYWYLDCVLG